MSGDISIEGEKPLLKGPVNPLLIPFSSDLFNSPDNPSQNSSTNPPETTQTSKNDFHDACFNSPEIERTISCYTESGRIADIALSQILEATQAKGIVFDIDDCLIKSEDTQVKVWKETFYEWAKEIGREDDTEAIQAICDNLDESFRTGDMDGLMRGIFNTAAKYGFIIQGINTVPTLEEYLKEKRIPLLVRHCDNGDIRLNQGVAEMLRYLHEMQIPIGVFTSAPNEIASTILHALLRQEDLSFNQIIPQENRVFGPDVSKNKPDPEGWIKAATQMKINFNEVLIVDDRLNVLMEVAKKRSFGSPAGVIGLCPQQSRSQWKAFNERQDFGENTWAILLTDDFACLTYDE